MNKKIIGPVVIILLGFVVYFAFSFINGCDLTNDNFDKSHFSTLADQIKSCQNEMWIIQNIVFAFLEVVGIIKIIIIVKKQEK